MARLEQWSGKRLGDPHDPLLVSVRSGGRYSMPGMMETVLNVGLNDTSVDGLAAVSQDERFAWDSYRRLIQMYGATVLGLDAEIFEKAIERRKASRGLDLDTELAGRRLACRGRRVQDGDPGTHWCPLPPGSPRAAPLSSRRSLPVLERASGRAVPPSQRPAHPGGHRGERHDDGLRQPRSGLRHGSRVHPRSGDRRAWRLRRLPLERPGRGRRGRHPQHRAPHRPAGAGPACLRRAAGTHGNPGTPLPRPV